MTLTKPLVAALAAAAVSGISACSSSGSSPVPLVRAPRTENSPSSAASVSDTSFAVTIAGASAAKPQIMNGAQVDITVTGAADASSGYADAAGSRIALTHAADGSWRGTLQYIDEANPPPANPAIDVGMQFPAGDVTVHHIPIVELHE